MTLDILVIFIYLAVIITIGMRFSAKQSLSDYFLGGRTIPWLIASFSIVATETSTLTFISIPGLAYLKGLGFMQVALGYLLGRIMVALLLIPRYFEGRVETVYSYLQTRFGLRSRKLISVIFHITRLLADSVRLFATAIPLALLTGWDYRLAILVIGAATLMYTYYGGLRSVIVVDSIQLMLYIICALLAIGFIRGALNVSMPEIFQQLDPSSLRVFSLNPHSFWTSYNVISGILGGAFLSFATHGTDHLFVQRVLSCKTRRDAQKAMVFSGILIVFQFALFLILGLFLKVLFNGMAFERGDAVFPHFILNHLPSGVRGLMLAGIFAAAMSTLSSSINSLSSSTVIDLLDIPGRNLPDRRQVAISRWVTLIWGILLIAISILIENTTNPLVEVGLSIASITYGGVLFIFVISLLPGKYDENVVISGVLSGIGGNILILWLTPVFWVWYVITGCLIAFSVTIPLYLATSRNR